MAAPRVVGPHGGQLVSLGGAGARFLIDGDDAGESFRSRGAPCAAAPLLRRRQNPPGHVRMEAAEIVHGARVLQRQAGCALRRDRYVPILVSRRRRVGDKVAIRPFDRVADMGRHRRRVELELLESRTESSRRPRRTGQARPRPVGPEAQVSEFTDFSYFSDRATSSACCS